MASTDVEFNPFLPEFRADPYPFYHRLRAVDPVHRTPMGLWVLTRYDDVVTVLRDPRFGREGSIRSSPTSTVKERGRCCFEIRLITPGCAGS